jgi:hypothetical protein
MPKLEVEAMAMLLPRVDHIHARVGTPQSPQIAGELPISDFGASALNAIEAESVAVHIALWQRVWQHQAASAVANGEDLSEVEVTATPEYGPVPYTQCVPGTDAPATDVWAQTQQAAQHLQLLFDNTVADSVL